jgi:hypothetical protein
LVADKLQNRLQENVTIVDNGRIFTKFQTSEVAELHVTTTILPHDEMNLNVMMLSSYLLGFTVMRYYYELQLYAKSDAKGSILTKYWIREVLMMESANTS